MEEGPMGESAAEGGATPEAVSGSSSSEPGVGLTGGSAAGEPSTEKGEPSRAGQFARSALRWVTAVVLVFGLGFAATWLVRVRPLMDQVTDLRRELDQAAAAQDRLQRRVDELEGVEERNEELEESLLQAQGHLDLLAVLVDVTRAQLGIAQEDTAAAKIALEGTDDKLQALAEKLADQDVDGIRERLALVLAELDSDVFAARRDLEILSNTLLAMERDLFGEGN